MKIVINKNELKKELLIIENDEIVERYEETDISNRLEGNIYIGRPMNIIEGMQAAFVDIGEKNNAFIHFKDATNGKVNLSQPLLVQVKKDATKKKGAKLSSNISIIGRYIVYMPYADFVTISQKVEDEAEKKRLKKIATELLGGTAGAIMRTVSEGKEKDVIEKDLKKLIEKWEEIKSIEVDKYPKLIYKSLGMMEKILRDLIDKEIEQIITNDKDTYEEVKRLLVEFERKVKLKLQEDISEVLGLETQSKRMNERKIWLDSGAFITIDKTEALTAIDVNSGKYVGTKNLEQTSYEVNREATMEIAKQLRLRDIGGIIIIDYIDMQEDENKEKIRLLLRKCCKKDRSKVQIEEFTKLNLLEMTRKHMFSND